VLTSEKEASRHFGEYSGAVPLWVHGRDAVAPHEGRNLTVKIESFALERWMTAHELAARYDIAESGILPLSTNDLLTFEEPEERQAILEGLLETPLGYSEASGSLELRTTLASTYRDCEPENILVTTGAIEANFLLFNILLDPGDHVVAVNPAYQQLNSVPRAVGAEVALWRIGPESYRYDLDELERLRVRSQCHKRRHHLQALRVAWAADRVDDGTGRDSD
jgi:aspartate/methionine/tyrosine aminotransferase